jgi:hypothetical protein
MNPLQAVQEGGFMMYPIVGAGLLMVLETIVFTVIALANRERNLAVLFGVALLVSAGAVAGLGAFAYSNALSGVHAALASVNPEDASTILAAGTGEALTTIIWGLAMGLIPCFMGFVLLGVGFSRLPRFQVPEAG